MQFHRTQEDAKRFTFDPVYITTVGIDTLKYKSRHNFTNNLPSAHTALL